MAGTSGISTKRKFSSSSIKKKRSHNLSQVRKRKRSRSRVRKNKSKKLCRRDESISYSDSDDDSRSLSSSSDDDRRGKRSRPRTRSDVRKKSKKRSKKDSSSCESERNECRVKKRKRSKKNVELDIKKKSQRKKSKRVVKVSSSSSDSQTFSTCHGDSSNSSGEDRGRSEIKERGKRDVLKRGSKRRRYRSLSCSSFSRSSKEDAYQGEEKLIGGNTSRRLRSVITVMKGPEENEEGEFDRDGYKEEIIYDQDEYPSCRSNDSDDAKMKVGEKVKDEEETAVMGIDGDDRYEASYPSSDEYGTIKQFIEKKNEDLVDTELILRQMALENLRKFRGDTQKKTSADPKEQNDDHVKQSSTVTTTLLPHKGDRAKIPSAVNDRAPTAMKVDNHSSKNKTSPGTSELVPVKEDGRKLVSTNKGAEEIGMVRKLRSSISSMQDDRKLQEGEYVSEDTIKNSRPKPSTSISGREPFLTPSSSRQVCTSQASLKVKPLVPKSDVNIIDTETTKTLLNIRDNNVEQVNNEPGSSVTDPSCLKTETGEQSSNEVPGETKDASQYEQKTMSVMRGGEMVQVSYKVYIPKKSPALARRKLRR